MATLAESAHECCSSALEVSLTQESMRVHSQYGQLLESGCKENNYMQDIQNYLITVTQRVKYTKCRKFVDTLKT